MKTIKQVQSELIDEINATGDILFQYTYLIDIAGALPSMTEEERSIATKVEKCQSNVWLIVSIENGIVNIKADSDTLIVRGLLQLIIRLFDGRTPQEILGVDVRVLTATELSEAFAEERMTGFSEIIRTIRAAISA